MDEVDTRTRRLGDTDLRITPVGLGVMQFAGRAGVFRFMFKDLDQEQMTAIVRAGLEGGINWFDTAEMYGRGRSERGLANGLQACGVADDQVVVATKWFPLLRTAANIKKTIGERLRHLVPYSIDLYMVHQPWGFSSPEAEMAAMADLVEAGKIRSVGVSNFSEGAMRRAHRALNARGMKLAANQVEYSLMERSIERNGVLEAAEELGITIIAYSPLAQGLLTGKFHRNPQQLGDTPLWRRFLIRRNLERSRLLIQALEEIGAKLGRTPAQVAINWLIHARGDTVVAIPGVSKVSHAEEAAGAMGFELSDEDRQRLETLSRDFR